MQTYVIPAQAGTHSSAHSIASRVGPLVQGKQAAVYVLASKRVGTLYIGVTSDLCGRVSLHKQKRYRGFTADYGVDRLVYFEFHDSMESAIRREKQMKEWKRAWKIRLIEEFNPVWLDKFAEICGRFNLPEEKP